jgi:hypothetical protein
MAGGGNGAAVLHVSGCCDAGVCGRPERAAVIHAASACEGEVAGCRNGAAVADDAVSAERHLSGSGADMAGIAYPHAFFGAAQANFTGIHSAHPGDVQRKRWRRAPVCRYAHLFVGGVHPVAPGGHPQIVCVQGRVNFYRPGNDVGMILTGGIQPLTVDNNLPTLHLITGEAAVL